MKILMPVIDMEATGKNIEALRKAKNIRVKELQEVFGFSTPQAIYKWQHGATMPALENLIVLAAMFQVTIEDILVISVVEVEINGDSLRREGGMNLVTAGPDL